MLIARLTVCSLLIYLAATNLLLGHAAALSCGIGVFALFISFGLFTSVVSFLAATFTAALSLQVHDNPIVLIAATSSLCVMLAVMGAGAYSVDARLFGQRRVVWPHS